MSQTYVSKSGKTYTMVVMTTDVTEEIEEICWGIIEGWYLDQPIDWEDVWSRMERTPLADGTCPEMGDGSYDAPALKRLQRLMRQRKAEAS